jgi:hypothetical protein
MSFDVYDQVGEDESRLMSGYANANPTYQIGWMSFDVCDQVVGRVSVA